MKKYSILVSLFILSACSGPSEYGLFGNSVDMACHNCGEEENNVVAVQKQTATQSKETEIWKQEENAEVEYTPVYEEKPVYQTRIVEEETITTYKSSPRQESLRQSQNNGGETYFIMNEDSNSEGYDCSKPNTSECGLKAKQPKQDCECTKQDPKGSPCYEKMQNENYKESTPCAKAQGKKKCESKKKCCNVSTPIASPLDQISGLTSEQELQNAEIAKIRRNDKQKFESVWATKPISYEVNVLKEKQTIDEQIVSGLTYLSSASKPVCITDPKLSFAKDSYKRILDTSEKCCRTYIANQMSAKFGKDTTYQFLTDDYNLYKAGELCMFYTDSDINNIFAEEQVWDIVKQARNQCTCLNSNSLNRDIKTLKVVLDHKNLNKGSTTYKMKDEFNEFAYRNINQDISNLSDKLKSCPK